MELNLLGGQSADETFVFGETTPTADDATDYAGFIVGDYDWDGEPDPFCIRRTATIHSHPPRRGAHMTCAMPSRRC